MPRSGPVVDPSEPTKVYIPPEEKPSKEKPKKKPKQWGGPTLPGERGGGDIPSSGTPHKEKYEIGEKITQEEMKKTVGEQKTSESRRLSKLRGIKQRIIETGVEEYYDLGIPGYHGYHQGSYIISTFIDPVIADAERNIEYLDEFGDKISEQPFYVKYRKTKEGYKGFESKKLKETYEKGEWERTPLVTKIGRVAIGGLLYSPKFAFDVFTGMVRDVFGRNIRRSYTMEAFSKSFSEGKRWESYTWGLAKSNKDVELLKAYYTSPLAVTAYTYGVFNVGSKLIGGGVRKINTLVKSGKLDRAIRYIPKTLRDYPSKYADVRLAKGMSYKFNRLGSPTFLKGRGELLYGGRVIDRFASKTASKWGSYGTSWKYYTSSLTGEIKKVGMYPYEHFAKRPRWVETGRSYVAVGDNVSYISRGYMKSFFKPKSRVEKAFFKPSRTFDLGKVKRFYISDKMVAAELKGTTLKFKPSIVVRPVVDTRDFSRVAQLLSKGTSKQHSLYQSPLKRFDYTNVFGKSIRYYEESYYISKQWMNMSPVFKYKPKIGISNVSIIGSKIQLDSKKIFDRLSKPDVRLSMLQRTGLDISSITTPAMGTVSLNMMRQLQSQRVDTKYKPQLKMKQITKTDIDEPSYPMFKIPTPPSIKTTSTPFTIPSFLFEDDYTKRMLKNMSMDNLFGKGWRKRSWLNNKDVI